MGRSVAEAKPTEIGLRIKAMRELALINQLSLSHAVSHSKAVVYQLEHGIILVPSGRLVLNLARALGTTSEYILEGVGEPPPKEKIQAAFIDYTQGQDHGLDSSSRTK